MSVFEPPAASAPDASPAEQARKRLAEVAEADYRSLLASSPSLDYSRGFRALRDAQVATGYSALAVQAELAQTRQEVAAGLTALTDAVHQLTQTIGGATEALPVVVNQITDLTAGIGKLDRGLVDIAEAVDELGEEMYQQRWRCSWRKRLLSRRRRAAADRPEADS